MSTAPVIKAINYKGELVKSFNETLNIVPVGSFNSADCGNPAVADVGDGIVGGIRVNGSDKPVAEFVNGVATLTGLTFGRAGKYALTLVDCAGVNAGAVPCKPEFMVLPGQPSFLQVFLKGTDN